MTIDPNSSDPPDRELNVNEALLGLLWQQFNAQFPTEGQCLEELYKRTFEAGVVRCSFCQSKQTTIISVKRVVNCMGCKKNVWLTAGTFFHRIRRARPWLAAIWLMERGVNISSSRFQKLLGIAYSTAWNILKKLTTVIECELGKDALVLPCSVFSALISRRSRETPARSHPRSELDEIENSSSGSSTTLDSESSSTISQLSVREQEVYGLLSGQEMHFDQLCARSGLRAGDLSSTLVLLELSGLVERIAAEWYRRTTLKNSQSRSKFEIFSALQAQDADQAKLAVCRTIDFVRLRYHGISRKYLQHYLGLYWCQIDRSRWRVGALLKACLRFGHIRDLDIREYVSQAFVKLVVCR